MCFLIRRSTPLSARALLSYIECTSTTSQCIYYWSALIYSYNLLGRVAFGYYIIHDFPKPNCHPPHAGRTRSHTVAQRSHTSWEAFCDPISSFRSHACDSSHTLADPVTRFHHTFHSRQTLGAIPGTRLLIPSTVLGSRTPSDLGLLVVYFKCLAVF